MQPGVRRALVIESDTVVRRDLEEALGRLGWSTLGAPTPEAALGMLDSVRPPGLILIGLRTTPRDEWLFERQLARDPRLEGAVVMVASEDRPGEFEVHVDGQLELPAGNGFSLEAAVRFGEAHLAGATSREAPSAERRREGTGEEAMADDPKRNPKRNDAPPPAGEEQAQVRSAAFAPVDTRDRPVQADQASRDEDEEIRREALSDVTEQGGGQRTEVDVPYSGKGDVQRGVEAAQHRIKAPSRHDDEK